MKKITKLGQHFLVNRSVAKKIIDTFLPVNGGILEIGPGKGIMTSLLIEKSSPGKITAVEKDPRLCNELKSMFLKQLELVCADILSIDLSLMFPNESVNLISNIPYYISKELIDWLIFQQNKVKKAVLLVQREFAEKLLLEKHPIKINPQGIVLRHIYYITDCFQVHPGSFSPPPKVISTLISLEKNLSIFSEEISDFYLFVKQCFHNRRKTIFNNLLRFFEQDRILKALDSLKLNANLRAEQIHSTFFIKLFHLLKKNCGENDKGLDDH